MILKPIDLYFHAFEEQTIDEQDWSLICSARRLKHKAFLSFNIKPFLSVGSYVNEGTLCWSTKQAQHNPHSNPAVEKKWRALQGVLSMLRKKHLLIPDLMQHALGFDIKNIEKLEVFLSDHRPIHLTLQQLAFAFKAI